MDPKKQKNEDTRVPKTRARELTSNECKDLNISWLKALVGHNLPFRIFNRQGSYNTEFLEVVKKMRPRYLARGMPNSLKFWDTFLPMYYEQLRKDVLNNINLALNNRHNFGTIMFDGWEDINGCSVVNAMLRVGSSFLTHSATYFLDSVYTKEKKVNAEKYVEIVEKVMKSLTGDRPSSFSGISGTVSDSARACVKAKTLLTQKRPGIVMLQDQAHATDLLMGDLGKIPWVDDILSKVRTIVQIMRNNRKLQRRFRDLIQQYNERLQDKEEYADEDFGSVHEGVDASPDSGGQNSSFCSMPQRDSRSESDPQSTPSYRGNTVFLCNQDVNLLFKPTGIDPVRATAISLKRIVKTRFANAESMLEAYLRSRVVLKELIVDPEFDSLYDASPIARGKRGMSNSLKSLTTIASLQE